MTASGGELKQIFPTVMLLRRVNNILPINNKLRDIVLANEQQNSGINASNVGGWHSQADFFEWEFPEVKLLAQECMAAGFDLASTLVPAEAEGELKVKFQGGSWANVLREGGYNKIHNHPGALLSGCYYVSVGNPDSDPEFNGWIEFQDPRPGNVHGGKERVKPEVGMLLLFPGWLNHYVNPFRGEGERISIAFNIEAEFILRDIQSQDKAKPTVSIPAPE